MKKKPAFQMKPKESKKDKAEDRKKGEKKGK
jgi:hypothetical protein